MPNFTCQKFSSTSILCKRDIATKKHCQKCRYERCLQVGMKPSAVLSGDQKYQRFKNMYDRKMDELKTEGVQSLPSTSEIWKLTSIKRKVRNQKKKRPKDNDLLHEGLPFQPPLLDHSLVAPQPTLQVGDLPLKIAMEEVDGARCLGAGAVGPFANFQPDQMVLDHASGINVFDDLMRARNTVEAIGFPAAGAGALQTGQQVSNCRIPRHQSVDMFSAVPAHRSSSGTMDRLQRLRTPPPQFHPPAGDLVTANLWPFSLSDHHLYQSFYHHDLHHHLGTPGTSGFGTFPFHHGVANQSVYGGGVDHQVTTQYPVAVPPPATDLFQWAHSEVAKVASEMIKDTMDKGSWVDPVGKSRDSSSEATGGSSQPLTSDIREENDDWRLREAPGSDLQPMDMDPNVEAEISDISSLYLRVLTNKKFYFNVFANNLKGSQEGHEASSFALTVDSTYDYIWHLSDFYHSFIDFDTVLQESQWDFCRQDLISTATSCFIQYMLAQVLYSKSAKSQAEWASLDTSVEEVPPDTEDDFEEVSNYERSNNFARFCFTSGFFTPDTMDLESYQECCMDIINYGHAQDPKDHSLNIAFFRLLLFRHTPSDSELDLSHSRLSRKKQLRQISMPLQSYLVRRTPSFDLDRTMAALHKMIKLFKPTPLCGMEDPITSCMPWKSLQLSTPAASMLGEDLVIKHETDIFHANMKSVSVGEYFLKEFIMHFLHVPFSKNFYFVWKKVCYERVIHAFRRKIHHLGISHDECKSFFNFVSPVLHTLLCIKSESFQTLEEQVQFFLGIMDHDLWEILYKPNMQKILLSVTQECLTITDTTTPFKLMAIMEELGIKDKFLASREGVCEVLRSETAMNSEGFMLLFFTLAFSLMDDASNKHFLSFNQLYKQHLFLLAKRQSQLQGTGTFDSSVTDDSSVFLEKNLVIFKKLFQNIKEATTCKQKFEAEALKRGIISKDAADDV